MGIAGWMEGDSAVLLYDQYDVWRIDPEGRVPPINLTSGFGRLHNVLFHLASEPLENALPGREPLLLNAFSRKTKDNGFCLVTPTGKKRFSGLSLEPWLMEASPEAEFGPQTGPPRKARQVNAWLVQKQRADSAPNWFFTTDFHHYIALSDVHPERKYNWLRSQLVTWKTPDGNSSQGILYKPENFNPRKKYPLIFYYYERLSEGLHGFIYPDYSDGVMDIPTYVSNGYLVFTPDIHYKVGHPGQSVVNTVVSAARYLSALPYVDGKHLGLQGHSRGGWETNYLVTHTHVFAAAMSASGMSDYVSLYGGIRMLRAGTARSPAFEVGAQRIGATLWERPDLYIENSPIFKANTVTTPLLMMSNLKDGDIPFEQGIEFFTALRRLGKRAWLLQYDGEDHVVHNKAKQDLTFRMQQFFDHFLKNAPPPKWLAEGIPARLKGLDTGFELQTASESTQ
jgi:dienelactone hydrolase